MAYQQFFYDKQIRRYITQFIRMVSNFQVEFGKDRDGNTALQRVPVIYGDSSRQAQSIIGNNSENTINATPCMAVYIAGLDYDRSRIQNPTYVDKLQLRERFYDTATGDYSTTQGDTLTVERLMPVPYRLTIKLDIWTSNTEQKLQLIEQLTSLFNPALEIQSTDNYVDWTSITYVLLSNVNWSSRTVPVGTETNIDIATLTFELPMFISSPALVKKMGVIQKIIASVFDGSADLDNAIYNDEFLLSRQYITPLDYATVLLNNQIRLIKYNSPDIENFGEQFIKEITGNTNSRSFIPLMDTDDLEVGMQITSLNIRGQGLISANTESTLISGVDTAFINTVYPGTRLVDINGNTIGNVSSVSSNTSVTLTANAVSNISSQGFLYQVPITSGNCVITSIDGDTITTTSNIVANIGDRISAQMPLTKTFGQYEIWRSYVNVFGNLVNGTSQVRFELDDGSEIVGTVAYNPADTTSLLWTPDIDTVPSNTLTPINAIIDPVSSRPNKSLPTPTNGTRYLLTNAYNSPANVSLAPTYNWLGADNTRLDADANDIIEYNGQHWIVAFDASNTERVQYVTNLTTGVQYKWNGFTQEWSKAIDGFYEAGKWQLVI
jgi:hypothetical protein